MANIAALGECMIEVSHDGSQSDNIAFGGDTLNTAVYLARAGIPVDFVTAVGDDPYSTAMQEFWQSENVGTQLVQIIPDALPGLYTIKRDTKGERSFYYWRDNSPARQLFEEGRDKILFAELINFTHLYLSGITLSLYSEAVMNSLWEFFKLYRRQGGKIIFDSNFRLKGWKDISSAQTRITEMLQHCDIALPSFSDEQALFDDSSVEACLKRYNAAGVEEVLLKNGSDGCYLEEGEELIHLVPTEKVKAVDTTAAGDAFNGAYLAARFNGHNKIDAAKIGQQCAQTVILYPGAIVPKEVMAKCS